MLYLATVQKKTRFLRGATTELKLLACKRGENNWTPVSREEVIPTEEANQFNAGVLVLVELTANKRVQRVQEATSSLVRILQTFSRMQEKWEAKEREKESWQQGLVYQAAELNRRSMELKVQQRRLETQRQEIQKARQEIEQMRQALEDEPKKSLASTRRFVNPPNSFPQLEEAAVARNKFAHYDVTSELDMSTFVLENYSVSRQY
jgi:DNA repair exonuclease SbcCD nuclease subunit